MEKPSDEDFLHQLFKQRRSSRWTKGVSIGFLVSAAVWGLAIYLLADAAGPRSYTPFSQPNVAELLLEGMAATFEILFLGGALLFGWGYSYIQKRRAPEPMQRAEDLVFSQHRSDNFRRVVTSPAVLALVLLTVGFIGVLHGHREVVERFAVDPEMLRQGEELWRLFTSQFLHADIVHLLSNLVGLLFFGVIIDLRIGHLRTGLLMVGAGIVGALTHGLLTAHPEMLLLGASGMVYGVLGANLVLLPRRRIPIFLFNIPFMVPTYALVLVFAGGFITAEAFMADNVAWLGHLGGFVFGLAASIPFRNLPIPPVKQRLEQRRKENLAQFDML